MLDNKLFSEIFESKAPKKLLIVPAQLTLAAEEAAFEFSKQDGFFDFAVMSGNKLREEIVSKTGGPGRKPINAIGQNLILRKSIKDVNLDVFNKSESEEFIKAASDLVLQSKQNFFSCESAKENFNKDSMLNKKLSDLDKIFKAYEGYMEGKYLDSADGLNYATSKVKECSFIKESEIWFEGFYSFNKEEEAFLNELKANSINLHINLVCPKETFPSTLLKIYEADGKEDEALFVAAEILDLIRTKNLDAEDIAILSADFEGDYQIYKRIFKNLNIPLYIDEKKPIVSISELNQIVNLLDMAANGVRPSGAIAFVDDPDFTNYVKKYHIKTNQFFDGFKYGGEEKIAAEIKRDEFERKVSPFINALSNAKTAEEKCKVLYDYLLSDNLPDTLLSRSEELFETYPEISESYSQLWGILISLLDQIVELLGDTKISNKEFLDIIRSSFTDIKLGVLPEERGQIEMGDIYRSKAFGKKAIFITSFNDGNIPRKLGSETILSIDEIEKLESLGNPICKSKRKLAKEDFTIIYDAMEAAKENLFISYSNSNSEGAFLAPAYILKKVIEEKGLSKKSSIYTMGELTEKLLTFKESGEMPDSTWQSYAAVGADKNRLSAVSAGLLYKNADETLSKKHREKLLDIKHLSTTSIEKYARCPFAYFAGYGLKVKEPQDFALQYTDIGNIHHEVLDRLSTFLSADNKPARDENSRWKTITDSEIEDFVSKAIDDIKESDARGLFKKSNEESYYISKVKTLATRFAKVMVNQVRLGNIDEIKTEQKFTFDFAGATITGKIDRIDETKLTNERLVKVIDYKTGSAKFNIDQIEKGLDVQLMLYLEYASKDGALPIGSFYFKIANPENKVNIEDLPLDEISSAMAEKIAASYKLDGAYIKDEKRFLALDKTVSFSSDSNVVSKSGAMSEADFNMLRSKFKDALLDTFAKMKEGSVAKIPKKLGGQTTSCTYCPYKMVCGIKGEIRD